MSDQPAAKKARTGPEPELDRYILLFLRNLRENVSRMCYRHPPQSCSGRAGPTRRRRRGPADAKASAGACEAPPPCKPLGAHDWVVGQREALPGGGAWFRLVAKVSDVESARGWCEGAAEARM